MAHFAEIDKHSIVCRVIVVNNSVITDENGKEDEAIGIAFCKDLFGPYTNWVQCSYNGNMRYNYPGAGYTYDAVKGAFYAPKPYNSWVLNQEKFIWEAPIPYPKDGKMYGWNEEKISWEEFALPKAS